MKGRLKGLLGMWLAVLMIIGMLPVTAFAAADTVTLRVHIKADGNLTATPGGGTIYPGDTVSVDVVLGEKLNLQPDLMAQVDTGNPIAGWILWELTGDTTNFYDPYDPSIDYQVRNQAVREHVKFYPVDHVFNSGDIADNYLLEPIYSKAQVYTGDNAMEVSPGSSYYPYPSHGARFYLDFETQLRSQSNVPISNPGYVFKGWKVWAYGSGLAWTHEHDGVDYPVELPVDGKVSPELYVAVLNAFTKTQGIVYGDRSILLEPLWQERYRIIEPTNSDPNADTYYTVGTEEWNETTGSWEEYTGAAYQWYLVPGGGSPEEVSGQTGRTLTEGTEGECYCCVVTFDPGGEDCVRYTSEIEFLRTAITGTVTVTGTAVVGETVTADYTPGSPKETVSYQWYRDGAAIDGATGEDYILTADDMGKTVKVVVSGEGHYKSSREATVAKICMDGDSDHLCDDCGDKLSDCTPGAPVQENVILPGYTYGGSYDSVTYCTLCGAELSRKAVGIPALPYPGVPVVPAVKPSVVLSDRLDKTQHLAYIVGVGDNLFNPMGEVTRAEAVTMFFRLMDEKMRTQFWSEEGTFADVDSTAWYNVAVATMEKAGIIKDTATGGNFRPDEPITRAELAVMAAQLATVTGEIPHTDFKDVSRDHWAAREISVVAYAGWIGGYEGNYRPEDNLTRAECVTIINRMLERGAEAAFMLEVEDVFADVSRDDWFFGAVMEAAVSHYHTRTDMQLSGENFLGEKWTALQQNPDWAAMEQIWSGVNG